MAAKRGSKVRSVRLLRSEKTLTLENLETPVKKLNRISASQSFTMPYTPRRKSRCASAISGARSASLIGRSYSSTSNTTRCPVCSCRASINPARRRAGDEKRAATPALSSRRVNWSRKSSFASSGPLKLPPAKLNRSTGWRTVQSHRSWIARPRNNGSLPSNSSLIVSTSRLLPNRLGRDRKQCEHSVTSRWMWAVLST